MCKHLLSTLCSTRNALGRKIDVKEYIGMVSANMEVQLVGLSASGMNGQTGVTGAAVKANGRW
jgi:hypothetical protein